MFSSSRAHKYFLMLIEPYLGEEGFLLSKGTFKRTVGSARFEIPFLKSRDSRSDRLMFSMHAEVYVAPLDQFYRTADWSSLIPTPSPYDFAMYLRDLSPEKPQRGYWEITSDIQVPAVLQEALSCVPAALKFFERFDSEEDIIKELRELFEMSNAATINVQLKYPAYLLASGEAAQSAAAIAALKNKFSDNADARSKVERYGNMLLRAASKDES